MDIFVKYFASSDSESQSTDVEGQVYRSAVTVSLSRQFVDPAIASEPKEDWKPLENLVTMYCYDYQFHWPFPDESGQEGQRHNDEPGGDQIQAESKFCIAGTLNDAHGDWHLVRHAHHDNTHDDHKVISQDHGFVAEPVHGQQWGCGTQTK